MGILQRNQEQAPDAMQQEPPAPQPSSGPAAAPSPQAGQSPGSLGAGAGPGQPPEQQFKEMRDKAIRLVYDERFEQLLNMFEKNGAERFPRSMAVAVNTVLTELEKEQPMDVTMAANVGMDIYMKLLQDIITGEVVPRDQLTPELIHAALPETMKMYAQSHPDVSEEDVMAVLQEAEKGVQQRMAGQQDAPPTGSPAAPDQGPGMGGAPGAGSPAPM